MKLAIILALSLIPAESAVVAETQAQAKSHPLEIADAVGMHSFGFSIRSPQSVSPDSAMIAYSVCDPRKVRPRKDGRPRMDATRFTGGCTVWVSPVGGGSPVVVSHDGASWAPEWSPDSSRLAFYGDDEDGVHVWIWDRQSRTARTGSRDAVDVVIGEEAPLWTPDGKRIISRLASSLPTSTPGPGPAATTPAARAVPTTTAAWAVPGANGSTVEVQQSGPATAAAAEPPPLYTRVDMASIDAATGESTRLTHGGFIASYWISPDGRSLAFTKSAGIPDKSKRTYRWDLDVVSLAGGEPRTVVTFDQFHATSLRWSPDSRSFVYFSGGSEDKGASCYVVSLDGSAPRKLEGASDFGTLTWHVPVWDPAGTHVFAIDGHTLWRGDPATRTIAAIGTWPQKELLRIIPAAGGNAAWSPDRGASIFLSARDQETKRGGLLRVTVATGTARFLEDPNLSFGSRSDYPVGSPDGKTWSYIAQSGQKPPDLWVAAADFSRPRRLTTINPDLETQTFGATRVIDFTSRTGKPLKATLLLPAGYVAGNRYPLVTWVYGSDMGSDAAYRFGVSGSGSEFNLQMLATRGYAVLYPDMPLETGAHVKSLMDSVMPALDRAVELGIADPERLGVMGVSAGGYGTFALVTQTTRFKAAISCAGFGDLAGFYGHGWAPWLQDGNGAIGKAPWEAPEVYIANSPVYFLDRVHTPLLIEAGSDDRAVGDFPEHVFTSLKVLNRDATFLRYRGEGHGMQQYPNLIDFWNRITAFLDHYLKGAN